MFRIIFNYIKGYKKNTILCILGIAFSVTLMFSVIQMGNRLLFQFRQMLLSTTGIDFEVADIDMDQMDQIYSYIQNNTKDFLSMKRVSYGTSRFDDNLATIHITGVEGQWEEIYKVKLLAGKMPSQDNEICIEEKYCDYLEKSKEELLGKKLTLVVEDDERECEITYKVAGIISNVPTTHSIYYMFTSYDGAVAQMKAHHKRYDKEYGSIAVLLNKNMNDRDKVFELVLQIEKQFGTDKMFYANHINYNDDREAVFEEEGVFKSVRMTFYGIAVLVAFCLILFVYNTISIGMTEKIRQYGTMRCIGLNNIQMVKIMAVETLLYTVAGLILGIFTGNILNYFVANKVIKYLLNIDIGMYENSISVYVATIVLTLLSVVFAFVSIYLKIRKMQPVEMLNFVEDHHLKIKIREKENNLMQAMARRNLKRNKSTSRVLFVTLTISGTIIMVLFNAICSIDIKRARAKEQFANYEVYSDVVQEQYISAAQIKALRKKEGITEVYCQKIDTELICTPDKGAKQYDTSLVVYSDNLYEKFLKINHLKGLDVKKDEVAIIFSFDDKQYNCDTVNLVCTDYLLKKNPNVQNNSTVKVNKIMYDGYSLLGGATVSESERAYLIINEKLAKKIYGKVDEYTDILVSCKENIGENEIRQTFEGINVTCISLKEVLESGQAQLLGMGYMAVYILLAVIILSILIMSNIIKTNIVKRVKELGMLRSIGAEETMVRKLLCMEIMNLAIRAVLTSALLACPVSLYITMVLNGSISIKLLGYIVGSVVVLGGSYLFTFITVKKNLSSTISEMLRNA